MLIFLILFLFSSTAQAQEQMYVYKALKVTDGDTIKIDVSKESPLVKKLGLSVRINGIDTPEKGSRAKCKKENELAMQATKFTTDLVGNKELLLTSIKWDAYGGRVDAFVKVNGVDIGKALLVRGLAVEYDGKKKTKDWCK
jgi:endonuclease YncB( thermonuclease family)